MKTCVLLLLQCSAVLFGFFAFAQAPSTSSPPHGSPPLIQGENGQQPGVGDEQDDDHTSQRSGGDDRRTGGLNLSRDLVRLGIASQNLVPDDPSLDARPLFQAGLDYVKAHHTHLLTVDRGAYYFLTPQNSQTYLRFSALSDLRVDLAGSTVYFAHAFLQGFGLANCQRVELKNFQTDFLDPPYTHVQLKFVDPLRRALAYATLPNWADPVTFNGMTTPAGPPELWAVVFRNSNIVPGTSRMHVAEPIANGVLQLVQDNTPWTQASALSTLEPGDTIVLTQRGGQPPIIVFGGDAIAISNVTVHGASQIAMLLGSVSHSTVDHVRVMPRPGDGLIGSNADGIHFSISGPDNHIRHSFVTRTLDDALALDSLDIGTVISQSGPRQITVRRTFFERFPNGTAVNFVDPVTADELAGATIIAQNPPDSDAPLSNGSVELAFDRDLPAMTPGFGMTFADRSARGAGSSIEDNEISEILFGRGIWISSAEGVKIEHNRIGHTSNGGIVVAQGTTIFPGPPAHDIVIQSNRLEGSLGPMAQGEGTHIATGAIIVESTNNTFAFASSSPNTNITIQRNRIVDSGRSGIWVAELNNGKIQDNCIIGWDRHPELPIFGDNAQESAQLLKDFTRPLVIHNSKNVETEGNVIRRGTTEDQERGEGACGKE